jgi:ribose/xylose/arabinose/galactoside ABC-type transport system permease subunit
MLYCTKCGRSIEPGSNFCPGCGTPAAFTPGGGVNLPNPAASVRTNTFAANILGFIPMAFFLVAAFIVSNLAPMFFAAENVANIIRQFGFNGAIVMAAVLTSRAKGPDLSIGSLVAFSAYVVAVNAAGGFGPSGIFPAMALCVLFGAVNGAVTVFCRIPAVIATLITGTLLRYAVYAVSEGKPLQLPDMPAEMFGRNITASVILFVVAFLAAFLYIFFTALGRPKAERGGRPVFAALSHFFAYVLAAFIACIAGYYMVGRLSAATPALGSGLEIYILFVYFAVISSRLLDNRFAGALYTLVPLYIWTVLQNAFNLFAVSPYIQSVIFACMALITGITAFIANRKGSGSEI